MPELPPLSTFRHVPTLEEDINQTIEYRLLTRIASGVALVGSAACYAVATKFALSAEFDTACGYYAAFAASLGAALGCHMEAVDTDQQLIALEAQVNAGEL